MDTSKVFQIKRSPEAQEYYTPYYAVEPLVKYIDKDKIIWCPFDKEWSAFYNVLCKYGFNVIRSHIDEDNHDFFKYEPAHYDVIISNPPYNMKDELFERLYDLNKPYAMLMPLTTLQGVKRFKYMSGIQLLAFDDRIWFHKADSMDKPTRPSFAVGYFCKGILPRDLVLEHIVRYHKPLYDDLPINRRTI